MEKAVKWFTAGAIIGAITPYVLMLMAKIPGVGVEQATLSIPFQTTDTSLINWVLGLVKYNPNIPGTIPILGISLQSLLMTAIGGGLLFVVGGMAYEYLDQSLKLGLSKGMRLGAVLAVGTLLAGWIVNGFKMPSATGLIVLGIGSIVAGVVYYNVFKGLKQEALLP